MLKTRSIAALLASTLAISSATLFACTPEQSADSGNSNESTQEEYRSRSRGESTSTPPAPVNEAAYEEDLASWNWIPDMLDTPPADNPGYMMFSYPEQFKTAANPEEQYYAYWYEAEGAEEQPFFEAAPYGIYIHFSSDPAITKDTFVAMSESGYLTDEMIGGKLVSSGKMADAGEGGGYAFIYYVPLDDTGVNKAWFIIRDKKERGEFREDFENSISF